MDRTEELSLPTTRRRPRQRGWRISVELALLVFVFLVFSRVHNLLGTDRAAATANAQSLQGIERRLGVDIELSANQWLAPQPASITAAVLTYRLYYLPLVVTLLWVLLRHNEIYPRVRNTAIAVAALALLVYWLVPMSPPRFALAGVVDIVAENDLVDGSPSRDLSNGQNHYSAMPSLHVGWSALCAYAAWLALRRTHPRLSLLFWLFPLLMVCVVITTGNHYVLDVVGSAILLLASIAAALAFEQLRQGRRHRRSQKSVAPTGSDTV
ncbi:phosphatase PAP2 family protein [Intrasporangium mesophilum]